MRQPVLDQGYVQFIEAWGSDERIIESARMSTDKGFQGWGTADHPGDEKLLKYLWSHKHATPFEMAGMTIEVQAPIMVFREWHRHRTQSYNEMSGRYVELPNMFYLPDLQRLMDAKQATGNKQGSVSGFSEHDANVISDTIQCAYVVSRSCYDSLLAMGVAKEIARLVLPVAQYSKMRASANLRNWLAFLSLRLPNNAQSEIRAYAGAVAECVARQFPRTWELFNVSDAHA